jgi:class 3 adenylate cyclase
MRRQFVESTIAAAYAQQAESHAEEQRALLASMVPAHVIEELMAWIQADMSPEKTIAHSYERVAVAFVQLLPPEDAAEREDELAWLQVQHLRVDAALAEVAGAGAPPASPGASVRGDAPANTSFAGGGARAALAAAADARLRGDGDAPPPPRVDAPSGLDGAALPFVIKIKTMGDICMLAGPFLPAPAAAAAAAGGGAAAAHAAAGPSDAHVRQACRDMLLVFQKLSQRGRVRCGAHVGTVIGAVLGTNRLCFDVFGDAVNTGSRAMSTAPHGSTAVTSDFLAHCGGGDGEHDFARWCAAARVTVGPERRVQAKGKGELRTHIVTL